MQICFTVWGVRTEEIQLSLRNLLTLSRHVIKSPTIYKTNFTNVFPNTLGSDDSTPRPSLPPSDTNLLWCPQKSGMPEQSTGFDRKHFCRLQLLTGG